MEFSYATLLLTWVNAKRNSYMGNPTAPSDLNLSDFERSTSKSLRFEGVQSIILPYATVKHQWKSTFQESNFSIRKKRKGNM